MVSIEDQLKQTNVFIAKKDLSFNFITIIVLIVALICLNIFVFNPNYKNTSWALPVSIIINIILAGYALTFVIYSYRWLLPCIKSKGADCYRPVSKNTRYR